jgi:hypothetical protein
VHLLLYSPWRDASRRGANFPESEETMPDLPIRRMLVYRHGVGYFERRGSITGAELRLNFPRAAMDDILKSLIVLDLGAGYVRGIDFETPEDREAQIKRGSIHLSDTRSLLDLLRDLRGRQVRFWIDPERRHEAQSEETVEGAVIGIDVDEDEPLDRPLVSLYMAEQREVRSIPVKRIARMVILDDRAASDITYFLRAAQSEEDRRAAIVRLSEGEHDLLIGYIAPAPAWRVSYRLLAEPKIADGDPSNGDGHSAGGRVTVLLQGWGMFDNQLDEDLEDVELTLVAGMPVSFRYRLYEPRTPERPLVQDDERTVAAPIEFAAQSAPPAPGAIRERLRSTALPGAAESAAGLNFLRADLRADLGLSLDEVEHSAPSAGIGEERGALFQYRVAHPISVARGRSAMAPIVNRRLDGRKELLYNGRKQPHHPVASLRMLNETGLTLERGPVTVVERGDYAGEAVLPFTRAGAEMIVAYAVELGIRISEEYRTERQMAGLSLHQEYLLFEEWDIRRTLYRVTSSLPDAVDIVIEHDMLPGYDLFDTPPPTEQAHNVARWTVHCPPGVETTFTVNQRHRVSRYEEVRKLSQRQIQQFFEETHLDKQTFAVLNRLLSLYEQIERHEDALKEIEAERQKIYERQKQTQANLTPLGREGDEMKLRQRYVTLLNELEDRLNELLAAEKTANDAIRRLRKEIEQTIAAASEKN